MSGGKAVKSLLLIAVLSAFLAGCLSTQLPSIKGKGFALEEDEQRIWAQSKTEERKLDRSGLIYRDQELERYLNDLARRLVPTDIAATVPFTVRVVKDPSLNAFTYPDGSFYVHTGILASMDNEAQLATVFAHEISHVTHRHAVRQIRDMKNKTAFFATLGAMTGNYAVPLGALGALAAVTGYSRDLESEADTEGLRLMVDAGYDPRQAPQAMRHLLRDATEEERKESYFFGSHPRLKERLENFEELCRTRYAGRTGGIVNVEGYLRAVSPALLENARLDLKAGRFERARRSVGKYLTLHDNDAQAYFIQGETWRQEGGEGSIDKARESYLRAVSLDPAYPDPHRALGLTAYKQKDREQARREFERYLSLAPRASDRGHIEELLKALR
ncbi:MAG: tetratricopeptide repeat protein [Desulfuromonadales bacterium]|nr:MAG: tetratricopeptide repeat protein [Desulfuromonadales bacterium]